MSRHQREIEFKRQIEQLGQEDLTFLFCAIVATIDDDHLETAMRQIGDDDLQAVLRLAALEDGVREERAREEQNREEQSTYERIESSAHWPDAELSESQIWDPAMEKQ